ncbi:MAG: hypothetical protein AAGB24_14435 [Bacteroidota bacterium]
MELVQADIGDNIWTTIITILFALSLIAERISNVIKLNWKSLRERLQSKKEEKIRERNILWLALFSGCLVSFLAGADLFHLINNAELIAVADYFKDYGKPILGMLLTGFFISLGSKFWHDVLDIVLKFSELGRFRAEKQEMDNTINRVETKEKQLLGLLIKVYPEILIMDDFIALSVNNGRPELLFAKNPTQDHISFLDTVFNELGYTIRIAPVLQNS